MEDPLGLYRIILRDHEDVIELDGGKPRIFDHARGFGLFEPGSQSFKATLLGFLQSGFELLRQAAHLCA